MQKAQVFTPSRRAMMVGAMAASTPGAASARVMASADLPMPEGIGGPGKILVWVDEEDWRSMLAVAALLAPRRHQG